MASLKRGFGLDVRLGKKGMDDKLMFTIWEVIVVFMVVIMLTIAVRGISTDTTYWKKYHSTDLALMTDLVAPMNGDFIINYELKDINSNVMTNILRIGTPRFMIYLKEGSYFVYDESSDKDRFPQSHIFARDVQRTIIESNIVVDYIILYKQGSTIKLNTDYVNTVVTCPTLSTTRSLDELYFETSEIDTNSKAYSDYIRQFLNPDSKQRDKDTLFFIGTNVNKNIIYYDDLSNTKSESEKMACIIYRNIILSDENIKVELKPYSSLLATDFRRQTITQAFGNDIYKYWVYIDINTNELDTAKMGDIMQKSIEEYYK